MDVRVPVGLGDLVVIDLRQPVIGGHRPGVTEDQSSYGVGDGGILLDPPVFHLHVAVDDLLIVQDGGLHIAHFFPLLPIQDVGFRHIPVPALDQHVFHGILDLFHLDPVLPDLFLEIRRHPQRQHLQHIPTVVFLFRLKGLADGVRYFGELKFRHRSVPFFYLKHDLSPLYDISAKSAPGKDSASLPGAVHCHHSRDTPVRQQKKHHILYAVFSVYLYIEY